MHARRRFTLIVSALTAIVSAAPAHAQAQQVVAASGQTFRSAVNLVSIAAVVRDKRGKVMSSLNGRAFSSCSTLPRASVTFVISIGLTR